jgi:diphosphomevalonate decarboxylase
MDSAISRFSKRSFRASPDVALIKYWGKKDPVLRLPENNSISMILKGLDAFTTVEFRDDLIKDDIEIEGMQSERETTRVVEHLDLFRKIADLSVYAKVKSKNNFPKSTGLSSSGSGFAALTYATAASLGLELSEKELSIIARRASGTACRCVCGGFVEWESGNSSESSYSQTIYPAGHWDLRDIVVILSRETKSVSSTEGHDLAGTSSFFAVRQGHIENKLSEIKKLIKERDFTPFGELVEAEALEFHSILFTSHPSIVAWYPGTIQVIHEIFRLRKEGIEAYFTINTGFNVHVLTSPENEKIVRERMKALSLVQDTLLAMPGEKPDEIDNHLF